MDLVIADIGGTNARFGFKKKENPKICKIACLWYKPSRSITSIQPDFYLRTTSEWLVFPHELKGLSNEEIALNKNYIAKIISKK